MWYQCYTPQLEDTFDNRLFSESMFVLLEKNTEELQSELDCL